MVSKINGAFPLVSFKRLLLLRVKCASPNFIIKKKKRNIFAVRDFPEGCGPHGRFAATYDLETNKIMPRVYPPRRRISVIRHFPPGCGRTASQVGKKDALEAIAIITNGLAHKMSSAEDTSFEEIIRSDTQDEVGVGALDSNLYQSKLKTQAISNTCSQDIECFGNNMGRKPTNNMKDRILAEQLSGKCGSMNQAQGKVSTDLEFPVHRVTVLGLMAAPKCPWRHGKRASRSDITRGTTQIKRKKH